MSFYLNDFLLYYIITNSRSPEANQRDEANEEWRVANEPRLEALEVKVVEQFTSLELAEGEKFELTSEMTDLRERLAKAERRIAKLEAANVDLNIARDEAISSRISAQEELKYCKSDRFKKNIIDDDFKSSAGYNKEIGREAGSFLDKDCIHIIRQFHSYFEDKSILLRVFQAIFDNEVCRRGVNLVPFTAEEMDALRERNEKRGKHSWNPLGPTTPTFWELLDGSSVP